jgi:hypothetical protein
MSGHLKKASSWCAVLIGIVTLTAWIADITAAPPHHRCVCGPDGSCPPNAFHFGFYQTQWRTWPKPPRPEDQRKPEAVPLPKVQVPGVTEEDVDVPTRPKAAPKTDTLPLPGDETIKPEPKSDLPQLKEPPAPDDTIRDLLEPPVKQKESTKTDTLPKATPPTKPGDPFKDDLPDLLDKIEGTKKSPTKVETPPAPPKKLPDLQLPLDDGKKLDAPLNDLPKAGKAKRPALDLTHLDLSPRGGIRTASATMALQPAPSPRPVTHAASKSASPAQQIAVKAPATDNPLRTGWSTRRGPSPVRRASDESAPADDERSWSSRKNPLRDN